MDTLKSSSEDGFGLDSDTMPSLTAGYRAVTSYAVRPGRMAEPSTPSPGGPPEGPEYPSRRVVLWHAAPSKTRVSCMRSQSVLSRNADIIVWKPLRAMPGMDRHRKRRRPIVGV